MRKGNSSFNNPDRGHTDFLPEDIAEIPGLAEALGNIRRRYTAIQHVLNPTSVTNTIIKAYPDIEKVQEFAGEYARRWINNGDQYTACHYKILELVTAYWEQYQSEESTRIGLDGVLHPSTTDSYYNHFWLQITEHLYTEMVIDLYLNEKRRQYLDLKKLAIEKGNIISAGIFFEIENTSLFLEKHKLDMNISENLSLEELKRVNDRIYLLAKQHKQQVTLMQSLAFRANVFEQEVALSSSATQEYKGDKVNVNTVIREGAFHFFDLDVKTDELNTDGKWDGKVITLVLRKDNGEITGLNVNYRAFKKLLGDKTYEVLRTHVLLAYAQQMVRDEAKFREVFSDLIELEEPVKRKPGKRRESSPDSVEKLTENEGRHKKLSFRFLPRRKYERGDHTNGVVTGTRGPNNNDPYRRMMQPHWHHSRKALMRARELSRQGLDTAYYFEKVFEVLDPEFEFMVPDLQEGFEDGERYFSYRELKDEAAEYGLSVKEFLEQNGGDLRPRYHQYVDKPKNAPDDTKRVRYRKTILRLKS